MLRWDGDPVWLKTGLHYRLLVSRGGSDVARGGVVPNSCTSRTPRHEVCKVATSRQVFQKVGKPGARWRGRVVFRQRRYQPREQFAPPRLTSPDFMQGRGLVATKPRPVSTKARPVTSSTTLGEVAMRPAPTLERCPMGIRDVAGGRVDVYCNFRLWGIKGEVMGQ